MPVTAVRLVRSRNAAGDVVVRLGVRLLDEYLEFLGGAVPAENTVLAVAYDLKVFFTAAARLLRTGLRVSEYTGLRADAVVLIGAGPWLHVPVGKLHEDRYLPLHPGLVTLFDAYRARHISPQITRCCCPAKTAARPAGIPSPG